MLEVKITIPNIKQVQAALKANPKKVVTGISNAIKKSGFVLEAESKKAITSGPARAIKTGLLRSQLAVRELSAYRVSVYPLVRYAVFIHEGTRYMRSRPFFEYARATATPIIKEVFNQEIAAALAGGDVMTSQMAKDIAEIKDSGISSLKDYADFAKKKNENNPQ